MRSFEEYIGQSSLLEAKQNYIFGGTDDKNTDVGVTFDELREGDSVYVAHVIASTRRLESAKKYTIRKTRIESGKFVMSYSKRLYKEMTIRDAENRVVVYTYIGMDRYHIFATGEQEFLNKIMELTGVKKVEIKDETTLQEARQDYIFGGTDDRNTGVVVKTFGELEEGDMIYRWNKYTRRARAYKFVSLDGPRNHTFMFITVDKKGKQENLYMSERELDMTIVASPYSCVATNEEEFITTMESKFGIKVKSEDMQ